MRLLTRQAQQANDFLTNAHKWERERWGCQRLLQALNITYRSEEFGPAVPEANFEACLALDECLLGDAGPPRHLPAADLQGWRSLSLIEPTFARVLFAHSDAPDFLRSNLGRSVLFDVGIGF